MLCARLLLAVSAALVWPAVATAIQHTPSATARLHILGGGGIGAEWDTDGPGVGGDVSFDSGTGLLTISGALDVLNYYDPLDGGCPVDSAASNCAFNYAPDLDIAFTASYVDLDVTVLGGPVVQVTVNFAATGGTDLIITDSTDPGFGSVLEADLAAGAFAGSPTDGLSVSVIYNTATGLALTAPTGTGVLGVDAGTAYASLFSPTFIGIQIASLAAFANGGLSGGGLDELIGDSILAGDLVSFSAEAEGQVFNAAAGSFVPEPSTSALLALGALVMAGTLRSRD